MPDQFFSAHAAVIPCTLLTSLIQYARTQQLPYTDWFKTSGLDIEDILQGQIAVPFKTIQHVFLHARLDVSTQALGIELVKTSGLGSMGLLGFVMQSSKNVAQAFEAGLRFHLISGSVMNLEVLLQHDQVILDIRQRHDTADLYEIFAEEIVASISNCLRILLGQQYSPLRIEFAYPQPVYIQQYHDFFQCPISFGHAHTRIYFEQALLNQPISSANTANYHQAIQICEQHLSALQQQCSTQLSETICHYLEQQLPRRVQLTELSDQFKLSERQLRRRLEQENTSFQQLRQAVLLEQAKKLLAQHQSIELVSQALGFSEAREFRRAFKRWTNIAPSHFKQNVRI